MIHPKFVKQRSQMLLNGRWLRPDNLTDFRRGLAFQKPAQDFLLPWSDSVGDQGLPIVALPFYFQNQHPMSILPDHADGQGGP